MIEIAITNESTVLGDAFVQAAMRAIQAQDDYDLAPSWSLELCQLYFLAKGAPLPAGHWQLVIADNSDQAGALGYHETTVNGDPIGFCFAKDDLDAGTSWTVTWSHEHCEMRVDPDIQTVEEQDTPAAVVFRAKEVADPCEDDQFAYVKDDPQNPNSPFKLPDGANILLSDFVLPAYWNPNAPAGTQFDFMSHITAPLAILAGGYIGMLTANGAEWIQSTGQANPIYKRDPKTRLMMEGGKPIPPLSRRARRSTKDANWKRSER